ncbi:MAG: hypothetical protein HZRFUVUK_001315 [Candidatus Fervidibacterota bacterium]|jgi:DNA repair protein RadA/Sms
MQNNGEADMPKGRSRFVCQQCGFQSEQWLGRCPECSAFNSFVEEIVGEVKAKPEGRRKTISTAEPLGEIALRKLNRIPIGIDEVDRVLGGGVVPGSAILVGGEPGIGKSTLMLQVLDSATSDGKHKAVYVAAEESMEQIALRAERLGISSSTIFVLSDVDVTLVCEEIERLKPLVVAVDSIQAMLHPDLASAPGSVSQVRECTSLLVRTAKDVGTSIFLVGHVTKEGLIAGPKVLEHIVDTVLYLEGDQNYALRVLRAVKNRFGPVGEIGVFKMSEGGLEPVPNPSEHLLSRTSVDVSGSVVGAVIEGRRPLLLEIQALVAPTYFGAPRRLVTGMDYNRACMLIAVLERRTRIRLSDQDVYVNVAGGIRVSEPAIDLPTAIAIASSRYDAIIPKDVAAFGEVGLGGEVRPVPLPERRLRELSKLGFRKCFGPVYAEGLRVDGEMEYVPVRHVTDVISMLIKLNSKPHHSDLEP